jgi:ubiquinone/menaquinone biosynthesis C-methylase UbiE
MTDNGSDRKQLIAGVFDRAATGYGRLRHVLPFGRRLVELARLPAGARVLDVATGRGAVLFPAAEQVGPRGQVVGVDLSPAMVLATSADLERRGLMNARVIQMDAEALDFPDGAFDGLLCGFSLFFFPRLERALAEFRRVLKPQARLAVSTWGADDPRWDWYDDLVSAYGAAVRLRTQMLDQGGALEAALREAGFSDIQIITEERDLAFADEAEWWETQWSISGRAGLERLEAETRERFRAEAFQRLQALRQPGGFHYRYRAHFGLALNPGLPAGRRVAAGHLSPAAGRRGYGHDLT